MTINLLLIPVVSAVTGWLANQVAVRLLFHPRKPVQIFGIRFQGIIPKRILQLAEILGTFISAELNSFADIEENITQYGNIQMIMPQVEIHIDHFLKVKLPERMPVINMFIGEKTTAELKSVFTEELETLFPVIMTQYMGALKKDVDIEKKVTDKLKQLLPDKLEEIQKRLSRDFRKFSLAGAVTGLIIGIIQVLVILLL